MSKLVIRVEQDGRPLGEWPVDNGALTLTLVDHGSNLVLATFNLAGRVPPREVLEERATSVSSLPIEPPEQDEEGHTDRFPEILQVRDLQDMVNPPPPDEFDEGDTLVANAPQAAAARKLGPGAEPPTTARDNGLYDEVPVQARGLRAPTLIPPAQTRPPDDDISLSLEASGRHSSRLPGDDLSLPVASVGLGLDRLPDDDFTMPMPEDGQLPLSDDIDLGRDDSEPLVRSSRSSSRAPARAAEGAGARAAERRRSDTTGMTIHEAAEVWFRQAGEWIPRGTLTRGQNVSAFGGMVKCDNRGGLEVSTGARLAGSATLPSGESVPVVAGKETIRFPPGTSVILWSGDLGFYVRSNVQGSSGAMDDPSSYQRQGGPPRSWQNPRSDYDDGRS